MNPIDFANVVVAKLASNEKSIPNARSSVPKVKVDKTIATPSNEIMNKKVVTMLISSPSESTGEKQVLEKVSCSIVQ